MINGQCPYCDYSWSWGWDEVQRGYYAALCGSCNNVFWIELSRFGLARTHDAFLQDVAMPDESNGHPGSVDWANQCREKRIEDGISIQDEVKV